MDDVRRVEFTGRRPTLAQLKAVLAVPPREDLVGRITARVFNRPEAIAVTRKCQAGEHARCTDTACTHCVHGRR